MAAARERAALLEGVHDGSSAADRAFATRAFVAELATALVVPAARASGMVGDAMRLEQLPAVRAAFAAGDVGHEHVRAVIEVTTGASSELTARLEAEAVERASHQTGASLRRSLLRLRERLEPRPLELRRADAERERRVCIEPARDGMAWLSVFMRAERAHAVKARLDAIAARAEDGAATHLGAPAPAPGLADRTTPTQRAADLAGELLLAGELSAELPGEAAVSGSARGSAPGSARDSTGLARLTALGAVVPRILVTVPVLSLLGRTDEPAELDGYGPIDAETARELAAHAPSFQRILTHPESGAFLSYGRTAYRVPADLAGYLAVRDGGCRFPGCGRRARQTDLDHTVDWARGGQTGHENLAHLCRSHHRLKHRTRWRMVQEPGGVIRWTSPSGREIRTSPERPFVAPAREARQPEQTG